jgi:hypothetical protein
MAFLPLDTAGWVVWSPITSGPNRCKVVFVDEQGTGAGAQVYLWGDPDLGTDPITSPGAVKPYKYAEEALQAIHALNGLGGGQFAILFRRGGIFRGKGVPSGSSPPGANIRRPLTESGSFQFTGPSDEHPILIGAYGPEAVQRPILHIYEGAGISLRNGDGTSNILIRSLHFRAPRRLKMIEEPDGTTIIDNTVTTSTNPYAAFNEQWMNYDADLATLRTISDGEVQVAFRNAPTSRGPLRLDVVGVRSVHTFFRDFTWSAAQSQWIETSRRREHIADNITIEDCLFQGLCAGVSTTIDVQQTWSRRPGEPNAPDPVPDGFRYLPVPDKANPGMNAFGPFPRQPSNLPTSDARSRFWRLNRNAFDRLYLVPQTPTSQDARTNTCTMYYCNDWEILGQRQQFIGFLPEDVWPGTPMGSGTTKTDLTQGVYCHDHACDTWTIRDFLAYKGGLTAIQARGGKNILIEHIVVANHSRGFKIGHRQNNYDVDGQARQAQVGTLHPYVDANNVKIDLLEPRFMSIEAQGILIEAPDNLIKPGDDVRGFGMSVRRFHELKLSGVLLLNGSGGTSTGSRLPFEIGELGNGFDGKFYNCTCDDIIVHDWTRQLGVCLLGVGIPRQSDEPLTYGIDKLPENVSFMNFTFSEPQGTPAVVRSAVVSYAVSGGNQFFGLPDPGGGEWANFTIEASLATPTFARVAQSLGPSSIEILYDAKTLSGFTTLLGSRRSGWQVAPFQFVDGSRTIGKYAQVVASVSGTTDEELRAKFFRYATIVQRKGIWSSKFTAPDVYGWVRAGFELV